MGLIVGAYGVSHTGMIIRKHVPGNPQHEAVHRAFGQVRAELAALAPDVLVVIGSDHLQSLTYECYPQVCVGLGDRVSGIGDAGIPPRPVQLAGGFASALLDQAVGSGIDLAFSANPRVDHGFMAPLTLVDPGGRIPVVPVFTNTSTPPLSPLRRAVDLGDALRATVAARPGDERVAFLGTGGLSHWVATPRMGDIDTSFDHRFLSLIRKGAVEEMAALRNDDLIAEAGNGAPEIRNWLTVAAAVRATATVLAYEPVHDWATGIGLVRFDLPGPVLARSGPAEVAG